MNRTVFEVRPMSASLYRSPSVRQAVADPAVDGRPISDEEIDHAARQMNSAGMSAGGGGARLLAALLDPALDLDALAERIGAEPGLAIRLLRVANSPYYGQSGRVASVRRAAEVVGLQALRGIAAASCFDTLVAPQRAGMPMMHALRLHSLATACAAEALARRLVPAVAPDAFMAGLLHDLGLLVHWRLRPRHAVDREADPVPASALAGTGADEDGGICNEVLVYGASHGHCGRRLIEAWGLPASLSRAVALHGSTEAAAADGTATAPPLAGTVADLPLLLAWADRISDEAGFGMEVDVHTARAWPDDVAACAAGVAADLPPTLHRLGVTKGE